MRKITDFSLEELRNQLELTKKCIRLTELDEDFKTRDHKWHRQTLFLLNRERKQVIELINHKIL